MDVIQVGLGVLTPVALLVWSVVTHKMRVELLEMRVEITQKQSDIQVTLTQKLSGLDTLLTTHCATDELRFNALDKAVTQLDKSVERLAEVSHYGG